MRNNSTGRRVRNCREYSCCNEPRIPLHRSPSLPSESNTTGHMKPIILIFHHTNVHCSFLQLIVCCRFVFVDAADWAMDPYCSPNPSQHGAAHVLVACCDVFSDGKAPPSLARDPAGEFSAVEAVVAEKVELGHVPRVLHRRSEFWTQNAQQLLTMRWSVMESHSGNVFFF